MRIAASRRSETADTDRHPESNSTPQPRLDVNGTPSRFQQQFEFVEGLKSKSERQKTWSWVTTQHYRKKRYEERDSEQQSELEPKFRGRRRTVLSSRSSKSHRERHGGVGDGERPAVEQAVILNAGSDESKFVQRLGSGRADPFNSYPNPATRDVHELVDHCASIFCHRLDKTFLHAHA